MRVKSNKRLGQSQIEPKQNARNRGQHHQRAAFFQGDGNHGVENQRQHGAVRQRLDKSSQTRLCRFPAGATSPAKRPGSRAVSFRRS
jgi:hypothetical protein